MKFNFQDQVTSKSTEDLLDIYSNGDQYQEEYVRLIQNELAKREVDLTTYNLKKQHKEIFMKKLAENGKAGDPVFIALGFISALLGGVLGIAAGYIYSQTKSKELGDGTHYYYDEKTRKLGSGMMVLGIVVLIFTIVLKSVEI